MPSRSAVAAAPAALPLFITFTGLDEHSDLGRALDLSARFPVEWGVLFSEHNTGRSRRYPSLTRVEDFCGVGLRLSAHLCGKWSRDAVVESRLSPLVAPVLGGSFGRMQFNLRDGETDIRDSPRADVLAGLASYWRAERAIVQCRGEEFPADDRVDWLFDRSGGAGIVAPRWPRVPVGERAERSLVGYAGGLSPLTVADALDAISLIHPLGVPFWIDMESGVRTDEWLDLDKCEAVCRAVYGAAGRDSGVSPEDMERARRAGA